MGKNTPNIARAWLVSERWLATVPTALLVGMYGAAAVSVWSLGAAWVGFLLGAALGVGLASWAFTDQSSKAGG